MCFSGVWKEKKSRSAWWGGNVSKVHLRRSFDWITTNEQNSYEQIVKPLHTCLCGLITINHRSSTFNHWSLETLQRYNSLPQQLPHDATQNNYFDRELASVWNYLRTATRDSKKLLDVLIFSMQSLARLARARKQPLDALMMDWRASFRPTTHRPVSEHRRHHLPS